MRAQLLGYQPAASVPLPVAVGQQSVALGLRPTASQLAEVLAKAECPCVEQPDRRC